jgi:hypothetical protein
MNLILIFGCPPELRVTANSTLTSMVFAKLHSVVNRADNNRITLPQNLLNWKIPGNGELLIITEQSLLLENVILPDPVLTSPIEEGSQQIKNRQIRKREIKCRVNFLLIFGGGFIVLLLLCKAFYYVMFDSPKSTEAPLIVDSQLELLNSEVNES